MLMPILEKLRLFKNLCSRQVILLLTAIVLVCVLQLPTPSSSSSYLLKSQLISLSPAWEHQDSTPFKSSGTMKPKPYLLPSSHSGSVDGLSPASVNDTCICCKLMNINSTGLSIITYSEGFVSTPYICPAGVASIGYGSTRLLDGSRVTMDSQKVTKNEAKALLRRHLEHVEKDILRLIRVSLNKNEFSSLCSWTYNLGSGRLQSSTLRAKLNRGERLGAANEFPKWRLAGGRVLRGLVIRRELERRLFLTPITTGDSYDLENN